MFRFKDYHRTIIGYHGTRLSTALDVVNRRGSFKFSENKDDWLGHGIYFWEYAPQQALWWAKRRQKRQKWGEPIAVVASMIRLGFCFDMLDPYNVEYLISLHDAYVENSKQLGLSLPKNYNHRKNLDCAVFQYAYNALAETDDKPDTVRAVYVPTGKQRRVWARSWISKDSHIQVCVRNTDSILGSWLHHSEEE